ncbi:MAG: hypothetical protein M1830_001743 [Pleopsidium flavum]|nr:MAG: hypothetical protein M1830_001743 [Pleopsidium flavum]
MEKNAPLFFIADTFKVETCAPGPEKLFKDLSLWELLNLKVSTVLEIPNKLYYKYSISSKFLEKVMSKYTIQSTGKDTLERQFNIDKPIQYMLATTSHYSWPKGAAIAGIGSDNVVGIEVDNGARVDLANLEKHLQASLDNQQAVYAVVAFIGSTEEGAVDPLGCILALRDKFQGQGLSFVVHADAAWGGYFASMLPTDFHPGDFVKLPTETGDSEGFIPDASLRAETQEALFVLRYADSITVDPHKAGYIPYPSAGLCYRDERMRYLIVWASPYISRDGTTTSIGVYGVEGSKPGASAMSTFLSNVCIGLNPEGYGALLGEVTFTCSRMSAEWAAMSTKDHNFVVVPFNMLPSELKEGSTPEDVEEERQKIRDRILSRSNQELMAEDVKRPDDDKAIKLLRALGSDLNINAFACNFRLSDGTLNDDVEEANYLNKRIVERLSVDEPGDDPTSIPFFLTSTEFTQSQYGDCATNFKKRLGLTPGSMDLFVLRNVVMSPFPTEHKFIANLADVFQNVVQEEVEVCRKRNEIRSDKHIFLVQGTDKIYLIHMPMFYLANHRRQLIVSAKIPPEAMQKYVDAKKDHPNEPFILFTHQKEDLSALLSGGKSFKAVLRMKAKPFTIKDVDVTIDKVLKHHPLNSLYRDESYPSGHMPFYIYGTEKEQHIDHILVRAPNIQLSADKVKLELDKELSADQLSRGAILYANGIQEEAMQPFLPTSDLLSTGSFFFRSCQRFPVTIFGDAKDVGATGPGLADVGDAEPISKGTMTLTEDVYVDSEDLNKDIFKKPGTFAMWKAEFDKIGRELD